jgi:hypothetical protein
MFRANNSVGDSFGPVNPPVAVYIEHIAKVPTTLVMKEKAWSLSGVSSKCSISRSRQDDAVEGVAHRHVGSLRKGSWPAATADRYSQRSVDADRPGRL